MSAQGDFNRLLAAAARELAAQPTTSNTLERAVHLAPGVIPSASCAGIALFRKGSIEVRATTDEHLRAIDELQGRLREGPYHSLLREEDVIVSHDLAHDDRWPSWGPTVVSTTGVRSALFLRLFATGGSLGAFSLYALRPGAFSDDDVAEAIALAAHVGVALAATEESEHLRAAVAGRTVIGQAQGILMERFGLDADTAFGVLVRYSTRANVKLRLIAEQIVATRDVPQVGSTD